MKGKAGLDVELNKEAEEAKVVDITQKGGAPKRAPFHHWPVGGVDYRLKLTAKMICKLEEKFGKNLILLIGDEGIPSVAVMLTIIQAAMDPYHHGMTFHKVQELYDTYLDEGGNQNNLLADVIIPIYRISGFFTMDQAEVLNEEIKNETAL